MTATDPKVASQNQAAETASTQQPTHSVFSRRNVLAVGAIGVAGAALAACSSSSPNGAATPTGDSGSSESGSQSQGATGEVILAAADVPVGGAKLAEAAGTTWLVAQPSQGEIVCHSGICTHEGCPLTRIDGDLAICPCHNSQFDIFTGAVVQSPALRALPPQSVTVTGGNVVLG